MENIERRTGDARNTNCGCNSDNSRYDSSFHDSSSGRSRNISRAGSHHCAPVSNTRHAKNVNHGPNQGTVNQTTYNRPHQTFHLGQVCEVSTHHPDAASGKTFKGNTFIGNGNVGVGNVFNGAENFQGAQYNRVPYTSGPIHGHACDFPFDGLVSGNSFIGDGNVACGNIFNGKDNFQGTQHNRATGRDRGRFTDPLATHSGRPGFSLHNGDRPHAPEMRHDTSQSPEVFTKPAFAIPDPPVLGQRQPGQLRRHEELGLPPNGLWKGQGQHHRPANTPYLVNHVDKASHVDTASWSPQPYAESEARQRQFARPAFKSQGTVTSMREDTSLTGGVQQTEEGQGKSMPMMCSQGHKSYRCRKSSESDHESDDPCDSDSSGSLSTCASSNLIPNGSSGYSSYGAGRTKMARERGRMDEARKEEDTRPGDSMGGPSSSPSLRQANQSQSLFGLPTSQSSPAPSPVPDSLRDRGPPSLRKGVPSLSPSQSNTRTVGASDTLIIGPNPVVDDTLHGQSIEAKLQDGIADLFKSIQRFTAIAYLVDAIWPRVNTATPRLNETGGAVEGSYIKPQ